MVGISSYSLQFAMDIFKDAALIATELLTDGSHSLATCDNIEHRLAPIYFGLGPFGYQLQVGPYLDMGTPGLYPGKFQSDGTLLARNPQLLPFQLVGFVLGIAGFLLMLLKGKHPKSIAFLYSFLYFAMMNLTSIVCHNLSERKSELWEFAKIADLVFTGASSLSLVYTTFSQTTHSLHVWNLIALGIFTVIGDYYGAFPFTAEIVYIGTMIFACMALGPRLHTFTGVSTGLMISYAGLIGLASALPLDSLLCINKYTYTAIHVIFFSCDVIFFGFILISDALNKAAKTKKLKLQ
jgi:hypothetical protein